MKLGKVGLVVSSRIEHLETVQKQEASPKSRYDRQHFPFVIQKLLFLVITGDERVRGYFTRISRRFCFSAD